MRKTLLILLAIATSAFAQTKSVSPTGGGLNATDNPAFRTALGGTTIGQNVFTLTNPSAITFPRFNADNTVSSLSAADFRTAIGATTVGANFLTLNNPSVITFPRINANNTVSSLSAADFRTAIGAGVTTLTDSASLAATISNETGTGSVVFGNTPTLTTPVINVTSDATGDIYYRSAGGLFTRLPIGTNVQLLSVSGGGIPSWSTVSIPSVEVTLAGSETLTNKTLSTGTIISSPPTMSLGSDATGDIYYRNAGGLLTRLPVGSDGQVLTLATGIPSWATAGGGLTNWTDGISTAAPNATVPAVSFTATNAATNVDAVFCPKGTGGILGNVPDNTATGGNKRGSNAVDLQTSRTLNTQVASGTTTPTIGGGNRNTASGSNSPVVAGGSGNTASANLATVSGGSSNTASEAWSVVGGGGSNTASGTFATIPGGQSNSASNYAFASGRANAASADFAVIPGGQSNTANNTYSAILGGYLNFSTNQYSTVINGEDNTADGIYSIASGKQAISRGLYGAESRALGAFQNDGDNQSIRFLLRRQTTDDTAGVVLTANGNAPTATTRIAIPTNSVYRFRGLVAGRTNTGVNKTVSFSGAIKQDANAASTAMIGSVTYDTLEDAGAAAWVVTVAADTTNGALNVEVTGAAATTIRWAASVEGMAVRY